MTIVTVGCGEDMHEMCPGTGTDVYKFPQLSGDEFSCGCWCHKSDDATEEARRIVRMVRHYERLGR